MASLSLRRAPISCLHLPVLEDVLQRYRQRAFLDIELKVPGLESKVLNSFREYRLEDDYVVSSFLPEVVMEVKTRSAKVQAGIICDKPGQLAGWRETTVEYVIPHYSLVTRQVGRGGAQRRARSCSRGR